MTASAGGSAQPRVRPTRKGNRAQVRGDRTRAIIIDETIRCVIEEGFSAASANHIAERAGVTWGVIQYHFGDRNGLLSAVVAHGYEKFRGTIESATVPESPPDQRVAAVVTAAWAAFSSFESRASLEILIAARAGRDRSRMTELEAMARDMRRLGGVLVGEARNGRTADLVIGEVLWATLRGLVLSQMLSQGAVDSSRERAVLVDLISAFIDGGPPPG
jgi:TetR/AcrR family transcriptional regulator, regulator of cefoperazone and chloramphenicol sensitivity